MLGTRIALLRRQKQLSQLELARLLGVSASAVGMYEQGRREPSAQALVAMARIFGVSTDHLLTGEKAPTPEQILLRASQVLDGELCLRSADGRTRPFTREDLALLLAALPGE